MYSKDSFIFIYIGLLLLLYSLTLISSNQKLTFFFTKFYFIKMMYIKKDIQIMNYIYTYKLCKSDASHSINSILSHTT